MDKVVDELKAQREIELERFEHKCGREFSDMEKNIFRSGFMRGIRRRDEQVFGQWNKQQDRIL